MFRHFKDFFFLYTSLVKDKRVPARSKYLPWIGLLYLIMPLDIMPDMIPVLGQIDDIGIVGILLYMAITAINDNIYKEYKSGKYPDAIDVTPK